MAGLLNVTAVSGVGPGYTLDVAATAGATAGDHVSDSSGRVYRVENVPDSTHIDVQDDLPPDSPYGVPATGNGAVYTPTANQQFSQAPFGTPAWDAINRRDFRLMDVSAGGSESPDSVKDKDLTTPPGSPTVGDRYIVASGGTGAWTGKDDQIAEWNATAWVFTVPTEGMTLWVDDEDTHYVYDGSVWDFAHDARKLQTRAISAAAPATLDVVTWNGTQWEPQPQSGGTNTLLLVANVRKSTPGTLIRGTPVYAVVHGPPGPDDYTLVEAADASDPAKMASVGLLLDDTTELATQKVVVFGHLTNFDTSSWLERDRLYVSTTPGVLAKTRPTGGTTGIQSICTVLRSDVGLGEVLVTGANRINDVPNLPLGAGWRGDPDGYPEILIFADQGFVKDKDLFAPPAAGDGDRYIIGAGATGDWATHDGKITEWSGTAWAFLVPFEGMFTWVKDEDLQYRYNGANWIAEPLAASSVTAHEGAIDHNALLNWLITQHRIINDSGSLTTELWSASKIGAELSAILAGIDIKEGVATSTTDLGDITLSAEQTLNGVTTSTSRVLVTEQATASENGIYVTAAGAWARAADADEDAEVTNGNITHVLDSGSSKYQYKYLLVSPDPIEVGVDAQTWEEHRDIDFGTTSGTATEGNDARIPTQDENDALVGTGTPSAADLYVNSSDPRMTDARTPIAHAVSHQNAGGDEISVAGLSGLLADAQTPTVHVSSHSVGGSDEILAEDIDTSQVGTSTHSTIQETINTFHSAGHISGGAFSDIGGGTPLRVAAGTGKVRLSDSRTAELFNFNWVQTDLAVPVDTRRYIGLEYNAGSPQVVARTFLSWNLNDEFPLGTVFNEGGTLHFTDVPQSVGDHAAQSLQRLIEVNTIQRDALGGGLILSETGTRNVTVSVGAFWVRLNRIPISAFDSSAADTFDVYYRDGGVGFTKISAATQWDNLNWDDDSGTLQALSVGEFANLWFYREIDGHLVVLYGRTAHATQVDASQEATPGTIPSRFEAHAVLIGRYVFEQGASTATEIDTVFETVFAPTAIANHNDLANPDVGDVHTQYQLRSEEGTANGYASLDAGGLVPIAQLPSLGGWPFSKTHTVDLTDPDADFNTIQDAIDDASDGDALLIGPGTYTVSAVDGNGLLITNKSITLIGIAGYEKTTIVRDLDAFTSDPYVLRISLATGDEVSLIGLHIRGQNTGGSGNTTTVQFASTSGTPTVRAYDCRFVGLNAVATLGNHWNIWLQVAIGFEAHHCLLEESVGDADMDHRIIRQASTNLCLLNDCVSRHIGSLSPTAQIIGETGNATLIIRGGEHHSIEWTTPTGADSLTLLNDPSIGVLIAASGTIKDDVITLKSSTGPFVSPAAADTALVAGSVIRAIGYFTGANAKTTLNDQQTLVGGGVGISGGIASGPVGLTTFEFTSTGAGNEWVARSSIAGTDGWTLHVGCHFRAVLLATHNITAFLIPSTLNDGVARFYNCRFEITDEGASISGSGKAFTLNDGAAEFYNCEFLVNMSAGSTFLTNAMEAFSFSTSKFVNCTCKSIGAQANVATFVVGTNATVEIDGGDFETIDASSANIPPIIKGAPRVASFLGAPNYANVLVPSVGALFGDGSDGNVTISTPVTITRDMFYNNLTITSTGTLNTAGWRVFVAGTFDLQASGAVQNNGGAGVGGDGGGAGGTPVTAHTLESGRAGGDGGTNANGDPGTGTTTSIGGDGAAGGTAGSGIGGAAGTATVPTVDDGDVRHYSTAVGGQAISATSGFTPYQTGAGGGGGGGDGVAETGGGGGAGGGYLVIVARVFANEGVAQALGGDGGAGETGLFTGGGGGGGGGAVIVVSETYSGGGTLSAAGGTGGVGQGGGGAGGNGVAGNVVNIGV